MNRLNDRLGKNLNSAVLSALKSFSEKYRYGSPTQKQKDETDYPTQSFIDSMTDNETERILYKRHYQNLTGRKPERPPSTRYFLEKVNS